jgi:hypothetical protein
MSVDTGSLEVGPDEFLAAAIVEAAMGGGVSAVKHRPTRRHRYLYDVALTDGRRAIARIALPEGRDTMRHLAETSDRLRPQGVPLPLILARDLESEFPYVVVQRLPGIALGEAIPRLKPPQLGKIAGLMVEIQAILATLPAEGRYGPAATARTAPYQRWSDVFWEWLRQARLRIERTDLMPHDAVDRVEARLTSLAGRLDAMPPVPFATSDMLVNAIVSTKGELSGITDLGAFCWGDPRVAPAFALATLMKGNQETGFADAWLALGGGFADAPYWLYAATGIVRLMSEYAHTRGGTSLASKRIDRARLEGILDVFLDRIDRGI